MVAVREAKDSYLSRFARFEKTLLDNGHGPLHGLRRAARDRFAALGFPTLKDEEWRFTNVAPLTRTTFEIGEAPPPLPPAPRGAFVMSLERALAEHRDLVEPH